MKHSYIPVTVDGAVVHRKAQELLLDRYWPEESVVHAHAVDVSCNDKCVVYKFPQMECPTCEGYGYDRSESIIAGLATRLHPKPCPTCRGTGEIRDPDRKPGEEDLEPKEIKTDVKEEG